MPSQSSDLIPFIRGNLVATLERSAVGAQALSERPQPRHDTNTDYHVIYEAAVEPASFEQIRLEFWVTEGGQVAVGIENWGRVARRLDARASHNQRFIGGSEPRSLSRESIAFIIRDAAAGAFDVRARVLLSRLVHASLQPSDAPSQTLSQLYRGPGLSLLSLMGRERRLAYRPW